ncbi:MAG: anhydro-N-acetylmuramic acid kinase [Bacteroidales bacterium]|nr:anhydro-N-acetylmuramic acid kinase [Bacteroidales bacterium]MDD4671052.1 anhydro-N-acetylmuramic acid kinase [Bacteroidales bacterium]
MEKYDLKKGINVIGLMSGTSLDGLDLCCVDFKYDGKWEYKIVKAESYSYPQDMKCALSTAQKMNAMEYARLNSDYGLYLGREVARFISENDLKPDLIASHGHTIFHQPEVRFTAQIGSGAGIAAESGVDCVCDFRTTDVALYGQGAPLVPIGDMSLFAEYDYCLNMGGFSNISFTENGQRVAFDISPVNYVLNYYTRQVGKEYDEDGNMARRGIVCIPLFDALNNLDFYTQKGPKSLGREWVETVVIPLIDSYGLLTEDILATFCEHVAIQIGKQIRGGKVLLTGGGALNKYLVERMSFLAPQCVYTIPDAMTINFKEALIFALLGAMYVSDIPNCLSTVTGARHDNIGGCMYKA